MFNFLTFKNRASERCHQEKRKTINGEDILFAMQTLGFDNYVEPLKLYLQKYREVRPYVASVYFRFVKFATLPFWREAAELKYWPVLNF